MQKFGSFLPLALLLAGCSSTPFVADQSTSLNRDIASDKTISAMFSPWEGKAAFDRMYDYISKGTTDVKVSVYSWSDKEFDQSLIAAAKNGATVRVVLHPSLGKKPDMVNKAKALETMSFDKGSIAIKISPRNMHEKFVIVDGKVLVNSSANMSNGAKYNYSESFVFFDYQSSTPSNIMKNFDNEFSILWNSSKDVISSDKDVPEERLPYVAADHQTTDKDLVLYSSSMNYDYPENKASSKAYAEGKYIALKAKGAGKGPWIVRDALIKSINSASKSIVCGFNHLNIQEIAEALVAASKRGVNVQLAVDNQEFMEFTGPKVIEMTPVFVNGWKAIKGNEMKEAPVRVKFYSHYPNPARWLLNHHKFVLIDFDAKKGATDKSILYTGSYNFSETAEHNQFDNLVSFSGTKHKELFQSFQQEFETLWNLERKNDVPNDAIVSHFTTPKNGVLPIHHNQAVSLSWSEILVLRNQIRKMEPAFLKQVNMSTSPCYGFDVKSKKLTGCPAR